MATYIHSKMTNNANEGGRKFSTNSKTKTAGAKFAGRGTDQTGNRSFSARVRKVDTLRTRHRAWGMQASAADALYTGGFSYNNAFTVNVPSAVGGTGTTVTIVAYDGGTGGTPALGTPPANTIRFHGRGSGATVQAALILAINGTAGTSVAYGSGTLVGANVAGVGIKGLTAAVGSTADLTDLTASTFGVGGNDIAVTDTVGTTIVVEAKLSSNKLTGGGDDTVKTAERLIEPGLSYGASKGTTYTGSTIGRTNNSAGDKDLIRDSAA